MEKFKLSTHISILDPKDDDEDVIPQKFSEGYFILYDEDRDKEFLINSTIKYYLDKFSPTPATQEEVLQQVKSDLKTDNGDLEKICSDFFGFLVKKKILVPEELEEQADIQQILLKAGDILDNYIIDDVIADKHNLDIYLATNNATDDKAVIKLLSTQKVSDPVAYKQELTHLQREHALLQKVNDVPAINHAIDFKIKDGEFAYIALEYINGKNLSRFFKADPILTEEDCLHLITKSVEAFSFLHECNLIHGDIHPSNIMVCEDNTIKIIDLGLSRPTEIEKNEVLKHGGVTFYMPPERINLSSLKKFSKEPDLFSDVYQLGIIMYFILYKQTPFDGFIWEELASNIKVQEIEFPGTAYYGFNVSTDLVDIINKCTAKQPDERYVNATAILVDLKKLVIKEQEQLVN
jgi:serine/threonine-protein kinase